MKSLAAVLLLAPLALSAQSTRYAAERARIDSMMNAEVAASQFAGVAIAVVKGRDTIALKAYGLADVENDVPATPEHVFRIGSVTKQFTSAAIMQLVEQGKLRLDDTLGAMLPGVPAPWRPVTLRQLLNHTSGIPSYTDIGPRWSRRMREDMLPDTIVSLVIGDSLNFPPGSRYRYNNSGYVLLGMIIEKASGQTYAQYLEERFYKPLGLAGTSFCLTRPLIKKRAQGYDRVGRQFVNADFLSMTQPYSAGSLCSTVRDLLKWNQALHGGRVVNATSFAAMTTPVAGAAAASRYGFGIGVDTLMGRRRVAHSGGINGFQSMLAHYPNDSLTVVVLSNSTPSPVGPIAGNLARIIFGQPLVGVLLPRVTLSPAERARYVGVYDLTLANGSVRPFTISTDGDRVLGQLQGQGPNELIPNGNHVFSADFDRSLRITFRVENGRAVGFQLMQGGGTMTATRKD